MALFYFYFIFGPSYFYFILFLSYFFGPPLLDLHLWLDFKLGHFHLSKPYKKVILFLIRNRLINLPSRVIIFRWLSAFYLWGSLCRLSVVCVLFVGLSPLAICCLRFIWGDFFAGWLRYFSHDLAYLHGLGFWLLVFYFMAWITFTALSSQDHSTWSSLVSLPSLHRSA